MTATEGGIGLTAPPADPDDLLDWFADARANHPVACDEHGVWQVFRYADLSEVLADPVSYSSDLTGLLPPQEDFELFQRGNFARMDPPQHRKLRGLVSKAFTPRLVAGLEPRIAKVTTDLLDALGGADRWDLVDRLAYPLPVTVIAEMLGVPAADQPTFRRWADAMFEDIDQPTVLPDAEFMESRARPLREMSAYLLEHIRARRAAPRDDLISHLALAETDGERLTDEEMIGFVGLLLLAGHITTTLLLGNAVTCLHEFPEAAAALRADRGLIPAAVEEVLRFRTPFSRLARLTTRDVVLGGQAIPAKRMLLLWVTSANRDGAHVPEPDRFDVRRQPNTHLTFGHGIHFCLGAPLARLETRVALGILLDRFAEIAVAGGAVWHDPRIIVGPRKLPVVTRPV
ncbi:cytochrome P450 [Gandjariella thermophila]|uniref:Cytochrome P450 n=1 Tax=Gandjariella thermophila TaxID=1931992 RepID=A0A4D4J568_9PSEU|nr:cytochrome P450 [Gandjariella thermophila]GDY29686.1 cytochrome P450 [Gandjariella thermophila]